MFKELIAKKGWESEKDVFNDFAKMVSPKDGNSMVSFERTKWYLENFYPVFTVPILVSGLIG